MLNEKQILEKRARVHNTMKDLIARAEKEGRAMSADESNQWDAANKDFDDLTGQLEKVRRMEEIEAGMGSEVQVSAAGIQAKPFVRDDSVSEAEKRRRDWRGILQGTGATPEQTMQLLAQLRGTNTIATEVTTTYGGYLTPYGFSNELERYLKMFGGMMQAAGIFSTPNGQTFYWPTTDDTNTTALWYSDPRSQALTVQDLTFNRVTYSSYTLGTLVKLSIELIQDEFVDLVPTVLAEIMGERIGRSLNNAFTTGDGSGKPTGFITSASVGKTTASATAITADELVDLEHSVDPAYRMGPNVAFMFNDTVLAAIKKLSFGTTDDRPLWLPSIREGEPDRLLGYRYFINQSMASTIATTQKTVAFGDWNKYKIRRVAEPTIIRLNERFMDELHVGVVGFARYDGKLLNTSAIKVLQQL